ncbi:MAG: SRPBCC family protein [Acidimicrobiia bacterium]|nr:SRPBCC family protein [Acidimicrobiia bacterium]
MTETTGSRRTHVLCTAERVLGTDPARVWMLVADPARIGEWAAIATVGFMGTELPQSGHVVFVRTRRWQRPKSARRIEIEEWEAGAGYSCKLGSYRFADEVTFGVEIHPEPAGGGVGTRIRLAQRMEAAPLLASWLQSYGNGRLERLIDRIERATQ